MSSKKLWLLGLLSIGNLGSSCGGPPDISAAFALDGTYGMVITQADPGSVLPAGLNGDTVIANGVVTKYLDQVVTDSSDPDITDNRFVWRLMIQSNTNPPIAGNVVLDVTDQGNGILVGDTYVTAGPVATSVSECTLTKKQPS